MSDRAGRRCLFATWAASCALVAGLAVNFSANAAPASSAPSSGKAGDKKSAAAVDPKALAALKPAIDALVKEARDGMKPDGKNTGMREKSDYFAEGNAKLPEGVTADVLLTALEQPIQGVTNNPAIESYVKWQLLSGLPQQLSDEQLARVYAIYHRAPDFAPNPGLRKRELDTALYRVGAMNPKNDVVINDQFDPVIDRWNASNQYIVEYRNALYTRLPSGFQTLAAGLEDLFARVNKGMDVKAFWERFESSTRVWSASAEPAQINQMVAALTKLQAINKDPNMRPYTRVIQNPDKNKMGLVWDARDEIGQDYLTSLINDLKDAARGGPANSALGGAAPKKP